MTYSSDITDTYTSILKDVTVQIANIFIVIFWNVRE
jgi:hypothetical protein